MNGTIFNPNLIRPNSTLGRREALLALSSASLAVALLLALNPALSAFAAPGDLDPTFGRDGKVTTDFFGNADEPMA